MMQAAIIINNSMPLCFRASRSDKNAETLKFIPGTALAGGLAAAHNRMNRSKDEFAKLFMSNKIRYGNLYPANFKTLTSNTLPVRQIPATARSCKRFSGFQFVDDPKEDNERHGVSDHLIPLALFALHPHDAEIFSNDEICPAPECDYAMTPFSGFYRHGDTWKSIAVSNTLSRMDAHTGISRRRGAVGEQIFYNREVLEEDQTFWGIIHCEDEPLWIALKAFLEDASDNELIYLGNSRSRGLGKAKVAYKKQITLNDATPEQLIKRVTVFNDNMKAKARSHNLTLPHALYISMTLQSDIILHNELMHGQTTIEPAYLEKKWGLGGMESVYQAITTRRVMGWNALYGLPKADDVAIGMGSVFLFGYNGNDDDTFWQTLLDIQTDGMGIRRNQGFGEITIADPFHTEVNQL